MNNSVSGGILKVCKCLDISGVEYMVVGGTAVAFYGYFRWSYNQAAGTAAAKYDLDIWYNPTYTNYFKLLDALENLGQDVSEFRNEQSPDPKSSFFRFEMEHLTLDLLPAIKIDNKFRTSFKEREIVSSKGIDIPVIGFDDLIKDKELNSKPKDIADIKKLSGKNPG